MRSSSRKASFLATAVPPAVALLLCAAPASNAETVLGRWGLKPRYETEYSVYRKEQGWSQRFNFDRPSKLADVRSSLSVQSKEDATRNDYRYGSNMFQLNLSRPSVIGKLSTDGGTQRQWTQTTQSLDSRTRDNISLSNMVSIFERAGRKLSLSFGGGWVQEKQVKEGRRGLVVTEDETNSTGWETEASLDGAWEPAKDLKFTARTAWDGSTEASSTLHMEGETQTFQENTDRSRNNTIAADLIWSRLNALKIQVKMNFSDAVAQYYQASAARQETKQSQVNGFHVEAAGEPLEDMSYGMSFDRQKTEFDLKVEANDRLDSSDKYNFTTKYSPHLPLLKGSVVQGDASFTSKSTWRERTVPYDSKGTQLELRFGRPLGKRFDLTLKGVTHLDQDFYQDGSLDKDRLRTSTSATLQYKVEKKFAINTAYASNRTDVVNIRAARAGQNQVEKDYRLTMDYRLTLPMEIQVAQNFQVSAVYTYYTYNEKSNSLTRTNRVTSRVAVPLLENSEINLEHIFERSDTGAYLYNGEGTRQAYSKGTERLRQDLKASLDYSLFHFVTFSLIERLGVNSSEQLSSGVVTRRDNHEMTGKLTIRRDLTGGLALDARFERTLSNQNDPYWRIDAKVQKQFD
ncbi:MAG: hypothetical protein KBD56_03115 [Candidatus Eisenbacteria bacterium]|nr:hypothetical protein [Candidatus Eisenbacteria bacterium]